MDTGKISLAAADALDMLDMLREDHGVGGILPPGTEGVSENLREALGLDDAPVEHGETVRGLPERRQKTLGGTMEGTMARVKDAEGKLRNVRIVGLSPDRHGSVGRIAGTDATFHVHSDEMTPYRRRVYDRLHSDFLVEKLHGELG